jgi:hypothetical protein
MSYTRSMSPNNQHKQSDQPSVDRCCGRYGARYLHKNLGVFVVGRALLSCKENNWAKGMRQFFMAVAMMLANSAYAMPVTWTIHDAYFSDGTQLVGSFTFDAGLHLNASYTNSYGGTNYYTEGYTDVSLTLVPDSSPAGFGIEYYNCYESPACYNTPVGDGHIKGRYGFGMPYHPERYLYLYFDSLTNEGGTRTLSGNLDDDIDGRYISLQSGYIVSNVVPIPAAIWLFGSALAGLSWIRRKKTS